MPSKFPSKCMCFSGRKTKNLPYNLPLRFSWDVCDGVRDNGRSRGGFILNSDWPIWSWARAAVEFDRARSNSMDQSELWMKPPCKRPLPRNPSQTTQESPRGKFYGRFFALHESFESQSTSIQSEIYGALWNCWFYCGSILFLFRRKRFMEWRLASDG